MREAARPFEFSHPVRLVPLAVALIFLAGFQASELEAGGLFSKFGKKEKKVVKTPSSPKRKPFQSFITPLPRTPPPPPKPSTHYQASRLPRATPVTGNLVPVERSNPEQLRVFILGDSQGLLPFGEQLQRDLVGQGYEVLFHAVKNGTPYFWNGRWPSPVLTRIFEPAATPEQCGRWTEVSMSPLPVAAYIESYDPDIFIFQAGTNFEEDLASNYTQGIVGLIDTSLREAASRGAKVLWIGPPDARDNVKTVEFQDRATATLRTTLSAISLEQGFDCFFDSRPVCPIPNDIGGDGEHPTDETGRLWGTAAAAWVDDSIERWRCDEQLRPPGGSISTPVTRLLTSRLEGAASATVPSIKVELELVAKSNPGDIRTLSYTDAFSVFQYRLRNAAALRTPLTEWGVTIDPATNEATIYVLHWAVHNNGTGPRATSVSARPIGEVLTMRICPITGHPLGETLATMPQFNDFDDFLAPLFLTENLLEERSF